jgi:hypothetical protein
MTAPVHAEPRVQRTLNAFTDPLGRWCYEFTLPGPARTKKTSQEGVRTGKVCHACKLRKGRVRVFPSKQFRAWQKVVEQYVDDHPELKLSLDGDVHLYAQVYRDRAIGDFYGFMQGVADLLQDCGIILNDRQVKYDDGSRLHKDADNPRVEVVLTVLKNREPSRSERDIQEGLSL